MQYAATIALPIPYTCTSTLYFETFCAFATLVQCVMVKSILARITVQKCTAFPFTRP